MPKLFISYRRDDSAAVAGRIFDRLQAHFGRSSVFMDVDSIPYGTDFRKYLTDAVAQCDVLLAIIGGDWLKAGADGRRRIEEPTDFVRIEIKAALDLGIRVVPILLGRTMMPLEEHLPQDLKDFAYLHAAQVDPDKDFHLYMDRIVKKLDQLLAQPRTPVSPAAASKSTAPTGESPASTSAPTPDLDALVKSVQVVQGYHSFDNRGQVFAKLKIALGSVRAAFDYLESLLNRTDEDIGGKAILVLIKHCPNPASRAVHHALTVMQTAANSSERGALARELATLLKANRPSWDADLQGETIEALKFVASYDSNHMVRLAAIEAIASLGRSDVMDFLVSIVRSKTGSGESTPDWSYAISILAKLGDVDAGRALAQICSEPQADHDILQSIVYWVMCHLYFFERFPNDVKLGLGEGAKAVLKRSEAVLNLSNLDAALSLLMCFSPEEALILISDFLTPGDTGKRAAFCRSLASVEGQDQKRRFLRRLKQSSDAEQVARNALHAIANDPDSAEYLKKNADAAINLLESA